MGNNVSPIKPSEVSKQKKESFPDAVFESFNEMIAQNFVGGSAEFKLKDVVKLMEEKGLDYKEMFAKGWLNVEEVYRSAGWKVKYDKPAYNETYDAYFKFSTK